MGTWNSRGLRGSTLEDMINHTNDLYREKKLALIQKIPTPITPVSIDKASRHITLAYFDQKSTVDYIGAIQGVPVCFDAKECAADTFPLQNVHPHQVAFMREFEEQVCVALLSPVSLAVIGEDRRRSRMYERALSRRGWHKEFLYGMWTMVKEIRHAKLDR